MAANAKNWELGYDTDFVVLGDGKISVDGIMVSGSRGFVRDPRLGRMVDERYKPQRNHRASRAEQMRALVGFKWCARCGDWQPIDQFSKDNRYHDKKHPECKTCRARHERQMYALIREAEGKQVRPYNRKEREQRIADVA